MWEPLKACGRPIWILLADEPLLSLNDPNWRIYAGNHSFPPHYVGPKGQLHSSLVGEGAAISGKVSHSVIFYNVVVEEGAQVTNSVILPGTVVEKDAVNRQSHYRRTLPVSVPVYRFRGPIPRWLYMGMMKP
jgi:ADP-glucose pyrophosphorylase